MSSERNKRIVNILVGPNEIKGSQYVMVALMEPFAMAHKIWNIPLEDPCPNV